MLSDKEKAPVGQPGLNFTRGPFAVVKVASQAESPGGRGCRKGAGAPSSDGWWEVGPPD